MTTEHDAALPELPALPEPGVNIEAGPWVAVVDACYYTAGQMRAYARAAIAQHRTFATRQAMFAAPQAPAAQSTQEAP